ncbi:MAG TPA: YraN family protein [bacterium]|jgi:putative endonuclease|nr:YraN family protein [bacterium]HQI05779.1 YraN family protein [bacterium]HQJ59377.1 YraN family protein [bacterium]
MNTRQYGAEAELFTANWLERKGYKILDRNFFMRGGEIDIVAQIDDTITFVEVRSWDRIFWDGGTPLETINKMKIGHIIKTALYYIQKKRICLQSYNIRFDVAGLIKNDAGIFEIDYIESAFDAEGY